jgi:hypothetical protein
MTLLEDHQGLILVNLWSYSIPTKDSNDPYTDESAEIGMLAGMLLSHFLGLYGTQSESTKLIQEKFIDPKEYEKVPINLEKMGYLTGSKKEDVIQAIKRLEEWNLVECTQENGQLMVQPTQTIKDVDCWYAIRKVGAQKIKQYDEENPNYDELD